VLRFVVLPAVTQSQPLEAYLHAAFPRMDREKVRALLQEGRVSVNGEAVGDGAAALAEGDRVRIRGIRELLRRDPSARGPTSGEDEPAAAGPPARSRSVPTMAIQGVRVLHHDDDFIVVDKPPGMLTASPTPVREKTLLDIVKLITRPRGSKTKRRALRVGVVHRLDREASGLVVFSLSQRGYDWLKEDFRARRVHRVYLALVEGIVGPKDKTGTIQSFLAEDESGRVGSVPESLVPREAPPPRRARPGMRGRPVEGRMGDDEAGPRLAITHYRVLAADNNRTLVQVRLETGRKHQIRVHMAEQGHPIVGDERYGARTNVMGRLGLHAAELGLVHPSSGRQMRFNAPPPARMWEAVGMEPPATAAQEPEDPASTSKRRPADTSWEAVASWYDKLIDDSGSDQYERVIVPGSLRLLEPRPGQRILDVACGQGVLSRRLAELGSEVTGVDAAASLIDAAKRRAGRGETYLVGDARDLGPLGLSGFDAAACIMALSNIDSVEPVFRGVASALKPGGVFVFIIVHPAFRAAGQTSWGWDAREGRQYRRIDGYLSPGHKRIQMHPGADPSVVTHTFHRPIQSYVKALAEAGLLVSALEEWPAQRMSTSGPRAAEENRARREIPMFLGVRSVRT
jgi:23S rRNA-/tRNA-specific pseudouridylate synthase/SAM-dependent methyltransferase